MVGRADDPSSIAYNAAGITYLPGTHIMVGYAANIPESTIDLNLVDGDHISITNKSHILSEPYAYLSHQLNERFWLGLGLFSRFGLDNNFPDNWPGRYHLTDIKFQTFSLVPTAAMKVTFSRPRNHVRQLYYEAADSHPPICLPSPNTNR